MLCLVGMIKLAIMSDSKQSSACLPLLEEDMPQTNYVNDLENEFMNQWNRSRTNKDV